MTMMEELEMRTRADGSIDTAYYMARGRTARAKAAQGAGRGLLSWLRGLARPQPKARLLPADPGRTVAPVAAPTFAAAGVRRAV